MNRILRVIGEMNCGGAEMILMNLYRNIDRDTLQFDFVVHTDKECMYDEEDPSFGGNHTSLSQILWKELLCL